MPRCFSGTAGKFINLKKGIFKNLNSYASRGEKLQILPALLLTGHYSFCWEQNHLDKAKPRVIGIREAMGPALKRDSRVAWIKVIRFFYLGQDRRDFLDLIHNSRYDFDCYKRG